MLTQVNFCFNHPIKSLKTFVFWKSAIFWLILGFYLVWISACFAETLQIFYFKIFVWWAQKHCRIKHWKFCQICPNIFTCIWRNLSRILSHIFQRRFLRIMWFLHRTATFLSWVQKIVIKVTRNCLRSFGRFRKILLVW